jgi:translation initiation factor eIF-2B subunit alpha/methylthioribose-1-phosphate isomerase
LRVKSIPEEVIRITKFRKSAEGFYDIPAIWYENSNDKLENDIENYNNNIIKLIDQRVLPHTFKLYEAKDFNDVAYVIKDMVIRGAPAIGAIAAYGIAQAATQHQDLQHVAEIFKATRPTAFDLFYAVDHMLSSQMVGAEPVSTAENYVKEIIARCRRIGEVGNELIKDGDKLLTHCNAGALATVDYGTALAPMRIAHYEGKKIFVYIDETRPRLQGARLTAWELYNEDIPNALIADNAAGFYMAKNEIDLVITGADRIASNGDAANKIGTYEKAVLAKENGVPFYIAAPISTFDFSITSGIDIPIEERHENEVLLVNNTPISNTGTSALNPAFDVTPNRYISSFITEYGLIKPAEIKDVIMEKKLKA